MSITVRPSDSATRPAIRTLVAATRGNDLTPAERAQQGFVQRTMDDTLLAQFQEGTAACSSQRNPANKKSLAVHRHYGMAEIGAFEFQEREYRAFAFDPAAFARRTQSAWWAELVEHSPTGA